MEAYKQTLRSYRKILAQLAFHGFYASLCKHNVVRHTFAAKETFEKLKNGFLPDVMEAESGESPIVKVATGFAACHASAARRVHSRRSADRDSGRLPLYERLRPRSLGNLSQPTQLAHPTSTILSMVKRSKEADQRRLAQTRHPNLGAVKKRHSSTQVACNLCRSKKSAVSFCACVGP